MYLPNKDFELIKSEYPSLYGQLDRLKGITGFITILGPNPKVNVFNRFNHVKRVIRLLDWYLKDLTDIDHKKCAFIGLFHDINRLPFAHNLEKNIHFSQVDYLPFYMSMFGIDLDEGYYSEFSAFLNKDLNYSTESRIVFLIDAIEGFIEDPLFAFTTLNLNYQDIPHEIMSILGFHDMEKLAPVATRLSLLFETDILNFQAEFDDVVFHFTKEFINKHKTDKYKLFDDEEFRQFRSTIRNELLIARIFPINNELISKGKFIAEKLCIPYISSLQDSGINPFEVLFRQRDFDVVHACIELGIIKEDEETFFYPDLKPMRQ